MKKLIRRGLKDFPKDPHIHYFAGVTEMQRGPKWADLQYAEDHFQQALEFSATDDQSLDDAYRKVAEKALSVIAMSKSDFHPGMAFDGPLEDEEEFDEDEFASELPDLSPEDLESMIPPELLDVVQRRE